MNEEFGQFLKYFFIIFLLFLFWNSLTSNNVPKENVYLDSGHRTQIKYYRQDQDFYRGVPVNVYK